MKYAPLNFNFLETPASSKVLFGGSTVVGQVYLGSSIFDVVAICQPHVVCNKIIRFSFFMRFIGIILFYYIKKY